MADTYQNSGFDENLIRPSGAAEQFDIANIDGLIGDNSLSSAKVVNLEYAKITNVEVQNADIVDLSITKLTAGTLGVAANVGNANVQIDGPNKRFIINDGTNDRGLFGYLAGKF